MSNRSRLREAGLDRSVDPVQVALGGRPMEQWLTEGGAPTFGMGVDPNARQRHGRPVARGPRPALDPGDLDVGLPGVAPDPEQWRGMLIHSVDNIQDRRQNGVEIAKNEIEGVVPERWETVTIRTAALAALELATLGLSDVALGFVQDPAVREIMRSVWAAAMSELKGVAEGAVKEAAGDTNGGAWNRMYAYLVAGITEHHHQMSVYFITQGFEELESHPQPYAAVQETLRSLNQAANYAARCQAHNVRSAWVTHVASAPVGTYGDLGTNLSMALHTGQPGLLDIKLHVSERGVATVKKARMPGVSAELHEFASKHPLSQLPIPVRFRGRLELPASWSRRPPSTSDGDPRPGYLNIGRNEQGVWWSRNSGWANLIIAHQTEAAIPDRVTPDGARALANHGLLAWVARLGLDHLVLRDHGVSVFA